MLRPRRARGTLPCALLVTACALPAAAASADPGIEVATIGDALVGDPALVGAPAPPAPPPAPIAKRSGGCPNTGVAPDQLERSAARAALLCAVNRARRRNGLAPLAQDASLRRAAGRHARDMARRGYFAHQRPGGPSLMDRLHAAGWDGNAAGETIAWGCGDAANAGATVRSWLGSPPHRAILLGGFARAGVGMAAKAPAACGPGATWVLDAGSG
jgi:uncharacterized protein YkwD